MKIQDLRIPQIDIQLEGDNEAFYEGWEEIVNNCYVIQFDVDVSVKYDVYNGDYFTPSNIEIASQTVNVTNAKYGRLQEDFYELSDEESEELANMIAKKINVV